MEKLKEIKKIDISDIEYDIQMNERNEMILRFELYKLEEVSTWEELQKFKKDVKALDKTLGHVLKFNQVAGLNYIEFQIESFRQAKYRSDLILDVIKSAISRVTWRQRQDAAAATLTGSYLKESGLSSRVIK